MRSKIAQKILDNTTPDVKIFVRLYADIVVRVNELIKEKGITQKELAEKMNKKPSEINRWLRGKQAQSDLGGIFQVIYLPSN